MNDYVVWLLLGGSTVIFPTSTSPLAQNDAKAMSCILICYLCRKSHCWKIMLLTEFIHVFVMNGTWFPVLLGRLLPESFSKSLCNFLGCGCLMVALCTWALIPPLLGLW